MINEIAKFTLADKTWTRRAFTEEFIQARKWLRVQMEDAGLIVTIDNAGNLIGRQSFQGFKNIDTQQTLAPIVVGSHCDTVVGGGRFDEILGVLAGIEIAKTLAENSQMLNHPLEIIDFLSEEPSDYGISCVGSRALTGALTAEMLDSKNITGESLAQAMVRIGAKPELIKAHRRGDIAHI